MLLAWYFSFITCMFCCCWYCVRIIGGTFGFPFFIVIAARGGRGGGEGDEVGEVVREEPVKEEPAEERLRGEATVRKPNRQRRGRKENMGWGGWRAGGAI